MTPGLSSIIQDVNINFPGDLSLIAGATESSTAVLHTASTTTSPTSSHTSQPLTDIQHAAHLNRLALQNQMMEGKGTEDVYFRHIKNYENFWAQDQDRRARENPSYQ
jgi:hypothetical protein